MAIKRLVIMGGCANGRGNQTRSTEFNIGADPEAAAVVFKIEWQKSVVVSLELVMKYPIPWKDFDILI
jgi:inosine-uridine nucleoside N-ribohydrolase